jgi:hypothetical protein
MTRPTTTGKAQDLITFTRSTTGTALAKISYGEELVTNGTFDSDLTGWTTGSNVTSSYYSGAAQLTLGGAITSTGANWFSQSVFETGKLYFVTFDATYVSGGSLQAGYGFDLEVTASSSGAYSFIVNPDIGSGSLVHRERITFAGASGAVWRIDNVSVKEVLYDQPDGTLQLFNHPINKPRIEYDASGNCLGLLVEEARTNRVTYSQDFTNSYWAKNDLTVAPAPVAAPDGTMTATHVVKTGSNAHLVRTSIVTTADRHSIWARTVSGTGTMYIGGTAPETLVTVTEEWQRLDVQCNNSHVYAASLRNAATLTEVYIWGSQAETGTFPTSYIPTNGSAVTRTADVASLAVSEFGYNQDQFSVVVESDFFGADLAVSTLCYIGESNDDRVLLYYNSQDVNYQVKSAGSAQAQRAVAGYVSKSAYRYKLNDMVLAGDGNIATTDTSANLLSGAQNNIYIGGYFNGTATLNGHIKSIQYYPLGLSNAQLQALTV